MSRGYSFQNEPFLTFHKSGEAIFTDWFVHNSPLTVRVAQIARKGTVNYNAWFTGKDNSLRLQEQLGVWFPIWKRGGLLYLRAAQGQLRLHYDDGIHIWNAQKGRVYNPFANIECNNQLRNFVLKAGINFMTTEWTLGSRIRYEVKDGNRQLSLATRREWVRGSWTVAGYKVVNLNDLILLTNAVKVRYQKGDNEVVFTAEQNDHRKLKSFKFGDLDSYFNSFRADWIRQVDAATRIGLQATFTTRGLGDISAAVRRAITARNAVVKLRASSNKSVAFSYRTEIKDYGSWTLGIELSDLGNTNVLRYGAQIDLNL